MNRADSEPPNVSIILDGAVRIQSASPVVIEALRAAGYRPRRSPHGTEVDFEPSTPEQGDLRNPDLIALLRVLASAGVAFARDYKQGWSPADVVDHLIEEGVAFERPTAAGFDGTDWWLFEHPWSSA